MPYKSLSDLPDSVKNNTPKHAQEIYRSAFNNAVKEYENDSDTEERAHKTAWAAIKNSYYKKGDTWIAKEENK